MLKNILGSVVFALVVFALVNFIGDVMVNPATAPHQGRTPISAAAPDVAPAAAPEAAPAAVPATTAEAMPTAEAPAAAQAVAQVADLAGDTAAGQKVFRRKCMGCHTVGNGEANRTGPNLWGIVGKEKGIAEGYRYSKPMLALGGVWSEAELMGFMAGPRTFLPDTKMTFAGLKKDADRVNVLAYLKSLKD